MEREFNYRFTAYLIGLFLTFESMLLLACRYVPLMYGGRDSIAFIAPCSVCLATSIMPLVYGRKKKPTPSCYEAYIVVTLSRAFYAAFGVLLYPSGDYIPNTTDTFLETMLGFTATGATMLDDIEGMPYGILFWRGLTQWIGGLGIVCLSMVLLSEFGVNSRMFYLSKVTGVTHNKICSKIRVTAWYIFLVRVLLTVIESALLEVGGMSLSDVMCHSMATTAIGGFSTKQENIAYWHSPYIGCVVSLFMLFSTINFSPYVVVLRGSWRRLWQNVEFRWFASSAGLLILIILAALILNNGYGMEEAFRKPLFQAATCHTSRDFATDDCSLWPPFTWMLLIFAMLSGGRTGSTSGGIKNLRMIIVVRYIRNQFRRILHPRVALSMRTGSTFDNKLVTMVLVFPAAYMSVAFIGWTLLMVFGVGLIEAMSTVISVMGNVEPGLDSFGSAFLWVALPDATKWIPSSLILIGRLGTFGFLLIFYKSTRSGSWS